MPRRPVTPVERTCPVCSTIFLVGGRGRHNKRTCSRTCANLSRYRRAQRLPNVLIDIDAAYLAGLIDGEGSVMLVATKPTGQRRVGLKLSIWMTHRAVLDWVCFRTGLAAVWTHHRAPYQTMFGWGCSGEAAEGLLRQLLPYLIVKHGQAELGIAFQERLRDPAQKADPTWQLEWKATMRALSPRGAPVT